MGSSIFSYLTGKLTEEITAIEGTLAMGKANDYAEYKFLCGKHRGLLVANQLIIDLADRMREDDDTD